MTDPGGLARRKLSGVEKAPSVSVRGNLVGRCIKRIIVNVVGSKPQGIVRMREMWWAIASHSGHSGRTSLLDAAGTVRFVDRERCDSSLGMRRPEVGAEVSRRMGRQKGDIMVMKKQNRAH